jgi:hypothetical protein
MRTRRFFSSKSPRPGAKRLTTMGTAGWSPDVSPTRGGGGGVDVGGGGLLSPAWPAFPATPATPATDDRLVRFGALREAFAFVFLAIASGL